MNHQHQETLASIKKVPQFTKIYFVI